MVFDTSYTTKSAQETAQHGKNLAHTLKEESVRSICLYGELGSGKTTFVQGFAKGLGVTSRLLSPTFIIVRRYHLGKPFNFFYHLDLYRINNTEELEELGLDEIFSDPDSIAVIEWADRMGVFLPNRRIDIRFTQRTKGNRNIAISQP